MSGYSDDVKVIQQEASEKEAVLEITWCEREEADQTRRGTMYCFKSCSVNQN